MIKFDTLFKVYFKIVKLMNNKLKKTTCSIIVSTYNWPDALYLTMQSIFRQTCLPNEIVIADDGSTEDTAMLIEELKLQSAIQITHIWHEDKGFRRTLIMNKAIKAAKHKYIIQVDGDIILNKNFVHDHLKAAKKGFFISGNRVLLNKELANKILKNKQIRFKFFTKGLEKRPYAMRLLFIDSVLKVKPNHTSTIIGCNLSFWREDFMAVNGYNNNIEGWGHEDIELITRLIKYGIKCKKLRFSANCCHMSHSSNSNDNGVNNYEIYQGTIQKKNYITENGVNQV